MLYYPLIIYGVPQCTLTLMNKHSSIQRLFYFYIFSLGMLLTLYYLLAYASLIEQKKQITTTTFTRLVHEMQGQTNITQSNIKDILKKQFLSDTSYQMMLMSPSGQTYIYDFYRDDYQHSKSIVLPQITPINGSNQYRVDSKKLLGWIDLDNGYQLYVNLYHSPIPIQWTSYRYWLPLLITFALFIVGLILSLKRRNEWEQLMDYTESLSLYSKEIYSPPPFNEKKVSKEFLRLGHTLSRINYQLHKNHRRTQLLSHRLARLVDHAPLPMIMIKRHGQISFFNRRFEQVFSTSYNRKINYSLTDFFSGADKVTHQLLTKLASQRVSRTLVVNGLEDNSLYQLHIMPWFGEHGQIHGFTAILNNITAFSEQIEQANHQLSLQQSRLADFDQLWSVMGHELRTPLSGMIGMLELLNSDNFNAEQSETLTTLEDTSQAMLSMLNGMLDMAKMDAGKLKVEVEPVDLLTLCQQICELMAGNARRKGIELYYFFDPQCPRYLTTDEGRLRQILMNLIGNAIKFTQTGYVALIIEPISTNDPRYIPPNKANNKGDRAISSHSTSQANHPLNAQTELIEQQAFAHQVLDGQMSDSKSATGSLTTPPKVENHSLAQWLCFSVKDTGIGIEEDEQSKLFSYFNQANDAISRQFGGTGLGLAISNNFAQLLGGFIHLESIPDEGSTFSICLPRHEPSYQPVYSYNTPLSTVCLIAFVEQEIVAHYLYKLCNHLLLPMIVRTTIDSSIITTLNHQLRLAKQNELTPIMLIDYEWYRNIDHHLLEGLEGYQELPKILLSMMPERGISSQILDEFDGYLDKPLEVGHLISELSRLSQPNWQSHSQKQGISNVQASFNQFLEALAPEVNPLSSSSEAQAISTHLSASSLSTHKPNHLWAAQQLAFAPTLDNLASRDWYYIAKQKTPLKTGLPLLNEPALNGLNLNELTSNELDPPRQSGQLFESKPPLILVAEDNPINQKVACKILEKLGYRSMVANNGAEAIELLQQHRTDISLILMDCRMPIIDGLTATQKIRANYDSIPIIALTANDTDEDRNACLRAGMDSFLSKPLNKTKLAQALKQFLLG